MNRYKIAVCDDDMQQLNILCEEIGHALHGQKAGFDLVRFSSGEEIAAAVAEQGKRFDILFLDIIMDELSGVEAARRIRGKDQNVSIVFITSSPDFVFEGYDVQALHYILKPVDEEKLRGVLMYDFAKRFEKNCLDIKFAGSVVRVPFDDIVYLESRGRKIIFATKSKAYETYGALSQFAEQLPPGGFIFSHKSFVVNLNHVSQITKTDFITDTKQAVPISKSCYPEAKKAFINFIGKDKF
ncbi:MAG: LytR/AlgR family response regulator transcription factor [Peptococcaceae bacterium]